jgi:hypothetical protein
MRKAIRKIYLASVTWFAIGCNGGSPDSSQPTTHPSIPLIANICGSGISSVWLMKNTSSGSVTRLECFIHAEGVTWGCYESSGGGIGAIAELDYSKTDPSTYWNPGLSQNLKWFLYNDPDFGWKPIIAYVLDFDSNSVTTVYYYSIPPGSAGEPLFQNAANTKIGWLSTHSYDNSCQPYPGEVPPATMWQSESVDGGYQYTNGPWTWLTGQWTTIVNVDDVLPCDNLIDYCGPAISLVQHEGAYDDYTVGTWEKWWFSDDPTGRFPHMLKKVQQTEFDGNADDVTIETSATIEGSIPASEQPAKFLQFNQVLFNLGNLQPANLKSGMGRARRTRHKAVGSVSRRERWYRTALLSGTVGR